MAGMTAHDIASFRHTFLSVVMPIMGFGERKRDTRRAVRPLREHTTIPALV